MVCQKSSCQWSGWKMLKVDFGESDGVCPRGSKPFSSGERAIAWSEHSSMDQTLIPIQVQNNFKTRVSFKHSLNHLRTIWEPSENHLKQNSKGSKVASSFGLNICLIGNLALSSLSIQACHGLSSHSWHLNLPNLKYHQRKPKGSMVGWFLLSPQGPANRVPALAWSVRRMCTETVPGPLLAYWIDWIDGCKLGLY